MLRFDILTLFPDLFDSVFSQTILSRAVKNGLLDIRCTQIRAFATDKHQTTDDIPYGGGPGMVMKPEPIAAAFESVRENSSAKKVRRIYFSPQGRPLKQSILSEYLQYDQIVLLCGRYEGVDERVLETCVDEEISLGDYVLTGGEFAAMVFIDALSRLIPGVVGCEGSLKDESFAVGAIHELPLLEYPQYTRPSEWNGLKVPDILLSGDHAKIEKWRHEQALARTRKKRPDLL